jgi:hypothetical protein
VERRPEQQALDRLILELREQPAPELDWQRMEARLREEPRPEAASAAASFWSRVRWPALGLVAAAALSAVVVGHHPTAISAPAPRRPVATLAHEPVNGDQLALGTHLTAGNEPLVVDHSGRARWTLEPHATAVLTNAGEFLTLQLETGALSAQVVPNPKPETFAVEVGDARVAVHGTAFRVERVGDRLLVSVTEGTVAVEAKGTHSAPSFLLRRGSRGNFALDGHSGSVEGNASAVVTSHAAQSRREVVLAPPVSAPHATGAIETGAKPTSAAVALPAALPQQPAISNIESGVSAAVVLMNRCFHDRTRSNGIRVSASTGLTLSVGADGAIKSVTFEPPLAPAVEECAVAGLRSLTFTRSVEGVTFTRILEVSR